MYSMLFEHLQVAVTTPIIIVVSFYLASYLTSERSYAKISDSQISEQIWQCVRTSLVSSAIALQLRLLAETKGIGLIYYEVDLYGWPYLFASALLYALLIDFLNYWTHVIMHSVPFLYRNFHSIHHKFRPTTTYGSIAVHIVDSVFAGLVPLYVPLFIFPIHSSVMGIYFFLGFPYSLYQHNARGHLFKSGILCDNRHHLLHHSTGRYNYATYLTLWDRLMNTFSEGDK